MRRSISVLLPMFLASLCSAAPVDPDWSANATIDPSGRANPYGWDSPTLAAKTRAGLLHAVNYPVAVTGFLVPERPIEKAINAKPGDILFTFIKTALSLTGDSDFANFKGFWNWLGLHAYPKTDEQIPYPNGVRPSYPMGVSFIQRGNIKGMTLSCATCHSAQLFGKVILGMTNRFTQANVLFVDGKASMHSTGPDAFAFFTGATEEEKAMYAQSRERMASVGAVRPQALGLDTSLAQVALSLAKRAQTPWAEQTSFNAAHPRPTLLDHAVADSKPAVWWNLKYKTRWLSDGSVLSGNPVLTNFLWNEIGRGADLHEVNDWLQQNENTVEELTTAVFANQAPKWEEYLPTNAISVERAKRGQILFAQNCAHCHGQYEKAWDLSSEAYAQEKLKNPKLTLLSNWKVIYHARTPVVNVGTDPSRAQGMEALASALNPLAFSQAHQIKIETQVGYVPPPLEGIFARYPYFHNNSVPNLCALMTPPNSRPPSYYSGEAIDPYRDFDSTCVGYPTGAKTPSLWTKAKDAAAHFYDTHRAGMKNSGHYEGIFTDTSGAEKYSADQKQDLIEFLKTL